MSDAAKRAVVLLFRKGDENPTNVYGPATDKEAAALARTLADSLGPARPYIALLDPLPLPADATPREYDPVLEAELDTLFRIHEHQLTGSIAVLPPEAMAGYLIRAMAGRAYGPLERMSVIERYNAILERLQRGIPAPREEPRPRRSGEPGFYNE